jgi:hypothetical protein
LLNFLIGDPRLHPSRWVGIDPKVTQIVETWLTRITLEAFFQVMKELPTDRDDMVNARIKFWRSYQHDISRAWLVVGKGGVSIAKRLLGKSFGLLSPGTNIQPDHCGLMLQLGSLTIFEMNKIGKTSFWMPNDPGIPEWFKPTYFRTGMYCQYSMQMPHQGAWQHKYEMKIYELTGIRRRG